MNNEYSTDVVLKVNKNKNKKEKKDMKITKIIGIILTILSIGLGLWVGLWLMFIGGIVQISNAINPVDGFQIAWGVVKIILASPVGFIIAIIGSTIGMGLAVDD